MKCVVCAYDENRIFGIDSIGYSDDMNITRFGPGQRNLYIVHYVISGNGYFNGKKVGKGQGFLIFPGMAEHYYPDTENPWSFLWVIFSDPAAEKIFEKYNADPQTGIFAYSGTGAVLSVKDFLDGSNPFYTSAELFEIFLHIFNNQYAVRKNFEKESDAYYRYAVNYINSNLFRRITVEEVTKVLGITQPYLYKIFTDRCGTPPKQYIINCKMTAAKRLLLETDLPVCEVAASVGYTDALNFSKAFRQAAGRSPKAYRTAFHF